jgi:hypothetical protein
MAETLVRPSGHLVRAAAWTVPVVSVAAADPGYAGIDGWVLVPRERPRSAVVYSAASKRHVAWDLTLTNGAVANREHLDRL